MRPSFIREYSRSLLHWWWVIVVGFALGAIGLYRELAKDENWPWILLMFAGFSIAQGLVSFDFWKFSRQSQPNDLIQGARRWIDEMRGEAEELYGDIQAGKLREGQPNGPTEQVKAWVDRAALMLESVRGETSKNSLVRTCNSHGLQNSTMNSKVCRNVLDAARDCLDREYSEMDQARINSEWQGERPIPG